MCVALRRPFVCPLAPYSGRGLGRGVCAYSRFSRPESKTPHPALSPSTGRGEDARYPTPFSLRRHAEDSNQVFSSSGQQRAVAVEADGFAFGAGVALVEVDALPVLCAPELHGRIE